MYGHGYNHGQYVLGRNFATIVRNAFYIFNSLRGSAGWLTALYA